MATTVHVHGISPATSEKDVRDFFSFCGKITSLSVTPSSGESNAPQSATVTFEKETAAKTALLLDNTQLGPSQVHVSSASSLDDMASKSSHYPASASGPQEDGLAQEDKPRARIVAEYLAHGYAISDTAIARAIALDNKHGFSTRFTQALTDFDKKFAATERAHAVDSSYGFSGRAGNALAGLHSYFEKAMGTPTGQRVRDFYIQGDRQVRDIHNEARRLADLKAGSKTHAPAGDGNGPDPTVCRCDRSEAGCPCPPGHCGCAHCAQTDPSAVREAGDAYPKESMV
jgi:hypothetical protein